MGKLQIAKRKLKIANYPRAVVSWVALSIALLTLLVAPMTRSAASGGADKPFHYEDDRLGEHKDESDKFKFVRIKNYQISPGDHLGDGPVEWSHDYPEAGLHLSKILSEL